MTWGVDEIDLRAFPGDGCRLCQDRDTSLTLLIAGVHHTIDDVLVRGKSAGCLQQRVDQSRLSMVDVRDKSHVSQTHVFS
jgi:hypothetical protein